MPTYIAVAAIFSASLYFSVPAPNPSGYAGVASGDTSKHCEATSNRPVVY